MLVDELPAVAQQSAVKVDILLCRELHIEAGAELDERRDGALDLARPLARIEHACDNLEHGRLAGAVGADQAEGLAPFDLEIDVVKRAELLELQLAAGQGEEVLLEAVELLGRDVEDHRDIVGFDDCFGVGPGNLGAGEAVVVAHGVDGLRARHLTRSVGRVDVEKIAARLIQAELVEGVRREAAELLHAGARARLPRPTETEGQRTSDGAEDRGGDFDDAAIAFFAGHADGHGPVGREGSLADIHG